jgi:transposase InsO family protein
MVCEKRGYSCNVEATGSRGEKTAQFVRRCPQCATYRRGKAPRHGDLQDMQVGSPMAQAGIDLTGPWPRSNNNKYILTFIDHFTKWATAVPIPSKDAETVAKALVSNIFTEIGCVLQFLSDQGKEFDNWLMTSLCHPLGTDKIRTTSYKASTNDSVERLHRSMNSMIAKCVDENQRNWADVLPHVMAAYRSSVHESTGFSPNFLFYGRELYAPIDLITQPPPAEKTVEDFVDEVEHNIRYTHQLARECLQTQAARHKKYYDMRVNFTSFQKDDWVWYFYPRRFTGRSLKWQRFYTGPFSVIEIQGRLITSFSFLPKPILWWSMWISSRLMKAHHPHHGF